MDNKRNATENIVTLDSGVMPIAASLMDIPQGYFLTLLSFISIFLLFIYLLFIIIIYFYFYISYMSSEEYVFTCSDLHGSSFWPTSSQRLTLNIIAIQNYHTSEIMNLINSFSDHILGRWYLKSGHLRVEGQLGSS